MPEIVDALVRFAVGAQTGPDREVGARRPGEPNVGLHIDADGAMAIDVAEIAAEREAQVLGQIPIPGRKQVGARVVVALRGVGIDVEVVDVELAHARVRRCAAASRIECCSVAE